MNRYLMGLMATFFTGSCAQTGRSAADARAADAGTGGDATRTPMARICVMFMTAGAIAGCAEERTGSEDLVGLRVFQVAYDAADLERDPYKGVAFMRLYVTDAAGNLVIDRFMNYSDGSSKSLNDIPFGEDLQISVEGWSRNPQTGQVGSVISRGRTPRLDLAEDSDEMAINVPFARVNMFSRTSSPGTAGAVATSLSAGRLGHTVTLLQDGRVLIAGGYVPAGGRNSDFTGPDDVKEILDTVEICDPATGSFSSAGRMSAPRAFHTAVLLDNQAVLFVGGLTEGDSALATVEAYDPFEDVFIPLGSVPLTTPRFGHTATVLDDQGHVLFTGGFSLADGVKTALSSAEVLCVPTFPCESAGSVGVIFTDQMKESRGFHTATRVDLGQNAEVEAVVLIGGEGDEAARSTLEIFQLANPAGFDPNAVPLEMVGGPRTRHTANYIHGQRYIHIVGGFSDVAHTAPVQRIDSFQVQQRAFNDQKEFFSLHARGGHGAVTMPGHSILLFGGWDADGPVSHAEAIFEYQDAEDKKTYIDRGGVGNMIETRGGGLGVLLGNDTVLVVGGVRADGAMNKAGEFFNPL